eukprot:Hpha_TRINITY_DN15318_c3_g2::TRINITY_DN15318_c3_g2_i2::g.89798::m.89798
MAPAEETKPKKEKKKKAPVPVESAVERAKRLIEQAKARAARLGNGGIECVVNRKTETTPMGFDFDDDLTLRSVKPDTPADDAGMTRFVGMQLRSVNNTAVGSLGDCAQFMSCKVLQLGLVPPQYARQLEAMPDEGGKAPSEYKSPWADEVQPATTAAPRHTPMMDGPMPIVTSRPSIPLHLQAAMGLGSGTPYGAGMTQMDEMGNEMPMFVTSEFSGADAQEIAHLRRENSRLLDELARNSRAKEAYMPKKEPPPPAIRAPSPDRFDDDSLDAIADNAATTEAPKAIKGPGGDSDSDSDSSDSEPARKGALVPAGQVVIDANQVVPVAGRPDHVMLPATAIVAATQPAAQPDPGQGQLVVPGQAPPAPGAGAAQQGALVPVGQGAGPSGQQGPGGGALVVHQAGGGGQLQPFRPRQSHGGQRDAPLVLPVRSNLAGMGHVTRQVGAPQLKSALLEAQSVAMPAAPAPILSPEMRDAIIDRFNKRHPISISVQEAMRELDTIGLRVVTAPLPHVDRDFSEVVMRRVRNVNFRTPILKHFDRRHPINAMVKEKLYLLEAQALHVALGPLPHAARDFSEVVMDRVRRYEEEGPPVFEGEDPDTPLMVPSEGPDGKTKMVCLGTAGMGEEEGPPTRRLPGQRVGDDDWRVLPFATPQERPDGTTGVPGGKPRPRDVGASCPQGCRRLEAFACEKLWVCSMCRGKFRKGTWFFGCDYCDYDLCEKCAVWEEGRQVMPAAAVAVLTHALVGLGVWKAPPTVVQPPKEVKEEEEKKGETKKKEEALKRGREEEDESDDPKRLRGDEDEDSESSESDPTVLALEKK